MLLSRLPPNRITDNGLREQLSPARGTGGQSGVSCWVRVRVPALGGSGRESSTATPRADLLWSPRPRCTRSL
ncbi:unnamed protein product [Gadus morhua 'NCC']